MAAALWDLDGTLIDSAEHHWISWQRTMAGEGFTLTRERFRASFGQRNDRILRTWLGADTTDETIRRIGDAKEAAYRTLMRNGGLEGLPGAHEWIDRLAARGWRQAIASSAPRLNVEAVLEVLGWQGKFDAIVGAEDVVRGKPDPEVFLTAAARVGVDPARCIVIEDAALGVAAAHAAGMRAIGVGSETAAADLHVPSLTALAPDAFDRLIDNGRTQRSRT